MSGEERGRQMAEMVQHIMDAIAKSAANGTTVDGQLIIEAFHFITGAMIEAHPEAATRQQLHEAAEAQKADLLNFMLRFRAAFDETGVHPWHRMNNPTGTLQ